MAHNEDTRVKIPALIHLTRLWYVYFSLKDSNYQLDWEMNIIKNVFLGQFMKLNDMSIASEEDMRKFDTEFKNISLELWQDDLWKQFYNRLLWKWNSPYKLIDWDNFNNNTFNVCTELTCKNGEDEFRPDITVFVNWLPLTFIEVKKPNNPEWIKAERDRINFRFKNSAFRKFINITQLLVFSNNMEYDDIGADQLQWAFYATTTRNSNIRFNNFREEIKSELVDKIKEIDEGIEDFILRDTNYSTLKYSPEFKTNKEIDTPTNRILSSLYDKERLKMILRYWIAYVDEIDHQGLPILEKHIMRYPQFFATKSIKSYIEQWEKRWIIWHTQWSWKTALAFYNVRYLTDYFSKKGIAPRFYFVVDRLDLLIQTEKEFRKRWLEINTVNSKQDLVKDFQKNTSKSWVTVINIQKFNEDTTVFNDSWYDIKVQRIYFIDEAHRSYDPKWSFLANLYNSDTHAIKIALTGTPLIVYNKHEKDHENEEDLSDKADIKTTRNIFWKYIHKYYYNSSIKDWYTLKLLREEIETSFKKAMLQIQKELSEFIKTWSLKKRELYSHKKYVKPMLKYILKDFKFSRLRYGDDTIWAMVVCDSSEQARKMFHLFKETQSLHNLTSALILHDEDDKETRKNNIEDYKDWKIDLLFVYSMLLTWFDAPRLKKLYLWRKIKAHNLLQTLTRVNRPYKDFRIWYVVDFADISKEFDVTNKAYFDELTREYDVWSTGEDEPNIFGSLFMSKEEIEEWLNRISAVLSDYSIDNFEIFSRQITDITDRKTILEVKKALEEARDLYNISRLVWHTDVLEKLDIKLLSTLLNQVNGRLNLLSLQESIQDIDSKQLLNVAIENVIFNFTKVWEKELKMLANDLQDIAQKTRVELNSNWNKKDNEWVSIYEEFRKLLTKHHIDETSLDLDKMTQESTELKFIYNKIRELNRKYEVLEQKFGWDRKYARIYKSLEPSWKVSANIPLYDAMISAKQKIDFAVLQNEWLVNNKDYLSREIGPMVNDSFKESEMNNFEISYDILKQFRDLVIKEYTEEYSLFYN